MAKSKGNCPWRGISPCVPSALLPASLPLATPARGCSCAHPGSPGQPGGSPSLRSPGQPSQNHPWELTQRAGAGLSLPRGFQCSGAIDVSLCTALRERSTVPGEGERIPSRQQLRGEPGVPLGSTKGPAGLFPRPKPRPSWGDTRHSTTGASGERHTCESGLALACAASVC